MSLAWNKSEHWPLPPDYPELDKSGQRQARLAVLSDTETAEDFVTAWEFFRSYYLVDDPDDDFFPAFYTDLVASPPFHRQMVYDLWDNPRTVTAAPRGSAKSIIMATEIPLLCFLVCKRMRIVVIVSTNAMAMGRGVQIRRQLEENDRILDDFGDLKPGRGKPRPWNNQIMHGLNDNMVSVISISGRSRGFRGELFLLDDVEFDPENPDNRDRAKRLTKQLDHKFKRVIVPMAQKLGRCRIGVIGTRHRIDLWIHRALTSQEPEFRGFKRSIYAAVKPPGRGEKGIYIRDHRPAPNDTWWDADLLWPEVWSHEELEEKSALMGRSEFAAEMCNEPMPDDASILKIDTVFNQYTIGQADACLASNPLASIAEVSWHPGSGVGDSRTAPPRKRAFGQLVAKMLYRGLYLDLGGDKTGSDWTALHAIGDDGGSGLWSLDLDLNHDDDPKLFQKIMLWTWRWKVHEIVVESISLQNRLASHLRYYIDDFQGQHGWSPTVFQMTYKVGHSKSERIRQLEWRLANGLIYLPGHLADRHPYCELYKQIRQYTPEMGGLDHDDAVDTLAMAHLRRPPGVSRPLEDDRPRTIVQRLRAGEWLDAKTGIPLIRALRIDDIDREGMTLEEIKTLTREHRYDDDDDGPVALDHSVRSDRCVFFGGAYLYGLDDEDADD